jgi:hypothetical protein
MFSTTVITTLGRESLARAVESVLSQDLMIEGFEVIVTNDSGRPLPYSDWQRSDRVTILHTRHRERCVIRNMAAAIARGRYLHFMDDDDWLLPGALGELHAVAMSHNAKWIYGTSSLVDGNGKLITEHHIDVDGNAFTKVVSGEWLPLQSSIVDTELFFEVGGFDWRLIAAEDKDLCRKVSLRADFMSTRAPIACITRDRATTTTPYHLATIRSLWSRDLRLDESGAFRRMRTSAQDAYWRGRLVRAYATCVAWNLQQRKFLRAISRAGGAVAGLLTSGLSVFAWDFWRALICSHSREGVC